MQDFQKAINNALWKDFNHSKTFPEHKPLIAHYTSISTLENILKNDEIWLSNPLYMNDINELTYGMEEGIRLIETSRELRTKLPHNLYSGLINIISDLFHHLDNEVRFDTYLACFCEHNSDDYDGILSMWRGYGANGNGAALVFNLNRLNINNDSPLIIAKVEYLTNDEITNKINDHIIEFANTIAQFELDNNKIKIAATALMEKLFIASVFTKNKGFSEENEWRLLYLKSRDPKNLLTSMLSYSITNEKLMPKLKLKIPPFDTTTNSSATIENLTERIILGPCTQNKFSKRTFERMLSLLGKSPLAQKVHYSSIPYRS